VSCSLQSFIGSSKGSMSVWFSCNVEYGIIKRFVALSVITVVMLTVLYCCCLLLNVTGDGVPVYSAAMF